MRRPILGGILLATLLLILAACSTPEAIYGLQASSPSIPPQGGSVTLTWQGSSSALLSVNPGSGITVNGSPYTGPLMVSGHSLSLGFPSNPALEGAQSGPISYTVSLAASGSSKSLTLNQPLAPLLWVADFVSGTVSAYLLPGITGSTPPLLQLKIADVSANSPGQPLALAFDAQGDLWVGGGGACGSEGFLEEFTPPFSSGEQGTLMGGFVGEQILSLAVSGGDLWVANACATPNLQEYALKDLSPKTAPPAVSSLSVSGTPTGLAVDASGNLWVLTGSSSGGDLDEFSGTTQELTISYSGNEPGGLAFDGSTLYAFNSTTSPELQVLDQGKLVPLFPFSLTPPGTSVSLPPYGGMVFDAQGNLWLTDSQGVQEFGAPLGPSSTPQLTLETQFPSTLPFSSLVDPSALAIWPLP